MKPIRRSLLVVGIVVALLGVSLAQQFPRPARSAQDAGNLLKVLEALDKIPPLPPKAAPKSGMFYTFQHGEEWPPLPGNAMGLPFWNLGEGFLILDDRDVDYVKLRKEKEEEFGPVPLMMRSMLSAAAAYGNPVYLTNTAASLVGTQSVTTSFSIAGGTNNVPYDILMSTNVADGVSLWNWLGIGYTGNGYSFSNQPLDMAFYVLARPQKTMVVGWGNNDSNQCAVPFGITNAVMVTGGEGHSLALLNNGTVVAWGQNEYGQGVVPTNLTGVSMIAAGWYHNVALLTNGTVTAWGLNNPSIAYTLTNVPPDLTNVSVVSAHVLHSLALRSNGTVVTWGYYSSPSETNVPSGLSNVVAISAGWQHNLAAKDDGTVVAWGVNGFGQTNVPAGLTNVLDVAAGLRHSLALRRDGTVVAWGDNSHGETNIPAGLSNVVAIAAGGDTQTGSPSSFSLALRSDNTVVAWGGGQVVLNGFGGLSNVFAIGNGKNHALAIRTGPRTPVITPTPTDQYQLVGGSVTFTGKGVGVYGVGYQWKTNGVNLAGATNTSLTMTNLQAVQDGTTVSLAVSNEVGVIVSTNAHIRLVAAPTVVSQAPMPTNQVAIFQTNLTLSVTATAPGQVNGFPLGYQWRFNGNNIAGANSSNYTVFVEPASLGAYSVVVTNAAGSVTSLVWQVSLTYVGSWVDTGTLAYHLATNAVARTNGVSNISAAMVLLSGWTGGVVYSAANGNMHLLTNSTWSTNFWLKGVPGLSATAIGISNGFGGQTLLTVVSPRHYLRATHVGNPPGLIAFLDTNNVIHWRTSIQQVTIGNDTDVGILDADVPSSVGFLPVMPTNFFTYLPTNAASHVQGVGMNQDMKVGGQPMAFGDSVDVLWSSTATAPFGLTTNWNFVVRSGDSSNPERFLILDQLVLVTQHHGSLSGPNLAIQTASINQTLHFLSTNNSVSTDYQLSPFVMTNWPSIR